MALISDLQTQMMGALGETGLISTLSTWLQARLLNDLNAVGQYCFNRGPGAWWAEVPAGDSILAPVTLSSMTVTAASKTFSGSGLTARMHGATVQVSGQTTQNRIFQTGASTWEFLMPHNGTTASNATIIVWHDCLNLASDSIQIQRPVMLPGLWELLPADVVADLNTPAWYRYTSHSFAPTGGYPVSGWDRQAATPRQYYVDGAQLYGGSFVTQIRLHPLPDAQYQINWMQREGFTKVTTWADTRTTIIPHAFDESVLIPLLRERLIDLPNFQGDKNVVIAQAAEARKELASLSEPQQERNYFVETSGGW